MTDCTVAAPAHATKAGTRPSKGAQNSKPQPPLRCAASAAEGVSPSLIVLTLRPDGQKFNGNRIERAQEAGFGWLGDDATFIGYACADTDHEIARHIVNKSDETFGTLGEIQVHIDPENCALQWGAGQTLMAMLQHYAVLIGGHICDGMGQPLADESIKALAEHIDAAMKKRCDADREARTVTLPSGERRELSELSFVYTVVREAGSKKKAWRNVHFDAPALHYYEGRALGMQMAGEVVQFYRNHKTAKLRLGPILREAVERCNKGSFGDYDKATDANVAAGFMDVLTTLIEVGARGLNPKWLEYQIAESERNQVEWTKDREERKAGFVARMKSAREAKRKGGKA